MRIKLAAMKNGVASSTNEDTEAALARPSPLTTAPPTQQAPPTAPQPAPASAECCSGQIHEIMGSRRTRVIRPLPSAWVGSARVPGVDSTWAFILTSLLSLKGPIVGILLN